MWETRPREGEKARFSSSGSSPVLKQPQKFRWGHSGTFPRPGCVSGQGQSFGGEGILGGKIPQEEPQPLRSSELGGERGSGGVGLASATT